MHSGFNHFSKVPRIGRAANVNRRDSTVSVSQFNRLDGVGWDVLI